MIGSVLTVSFLKVGLQWLLDYIGAIRAAKRAKQDQPGFKPQAAEEAGAAPTLSPFLPPQTEGAAPAPAAAERRATAALQRPARPPDTQATPAPPFYHEPQRGSSGWSRE